MNILITDQMGLSTVIGVGHRPHGSAFRPQTALQINGWITQNRVFRILRRLSRDGSDYQETRIAGSALPVRQGDCLFDTGSLFCFAGQRNLAADNVLIVLWHFPSNFPVRRPILQRNGRLNVPSAASGLSDGEISWDILD